MKKLLLLPLLFLPVFALADGGPNSEHPNICLIHSTLQEDGSCLPDPNYNYCDDHSCTEPGTQPSPDPEPDPSEVPACVRFHQACPWDVPTPVLEPSPELQAEAATVPAVPQPTHHSHGGGGGGSHTVNTSVFTKDQLSALYLLLTAFGVDGATINEVMASL